jgi:uncharacterized protein YuzE
MKNESQIRETKGSLLVEFVPHIKRSKHRSLEMVLDFGRSGEVMGIEIINLVLQAGRSCLKLISASVPADGEGLKYAYDVSCDAFYLRLRIGKSWNQKTVYGSLFLDDAGRIVGLSAEWIEGNPSEI